jgi:hypothetical protein
MGAPWAQACKERKMVKKYEIICLAQPDKDISTNIS